MPETRTDILGLGVSTIDDLLMVRHFPRRNEKQQIIARTRQCGGLTGTALVAAARMGCRCSYAIALGEGELSAFLRRELRREGIELLERADMPEAEPYHSRIIIEEGTGERTVFWDNSLSRPPLIGDKEMRLAREAGCLFVDHIFARDLLDIVREARRCGTPVVGDFERTTECSSVLMDLTDHIVLPIGYARQLMGEAITPEAAVRKLIRQPGRALACVTNGVHGAWYALGDAPENILHQPIFPMKNIVDSTGCGDVFHGVYAAGLVMGKSPAERIRHAAAAAALKTQKAGAQAGAPTLAELDAFLSSAV